MAQKNEDIYDLIINQSSSDIEEEEAQFVNKTIEKPTMDSKIYCRRNDDQAGAQPRIRSTIRTDSCHKQRSFRELPNSREKSMLRSNKRHHDDDSHDLHVGSSNKQRCIDGNRHESSHLESGHSHKQYRTNDNESDGNRYDRCRSIKQHRIDNVRDNQHYNRGRSDGERNLRGRGDKQSQHSPRHHQHQEKSVFNINQSSRVAWTPDSQYSMVESFALKRTIF